MSWFKLPSEMALLSALVGCVSLIAVSASAKSPQPPGLFSKLPDTALATLPQQAIAGKSSAVTINYGQLRAGRLFLTLPGGISYEAVREEIQDLGKGRFAWVGHASDDPDNTVVIAVSGKAVAGAFIYDGKLFKLEPRAHGKHVLSEVAPTEPAPELEPIPIADQPSDTTEPVQTESASAGSSGSVIDVLVAYTPAIESLYGSAGADALIIQAVAETNKAYSYSKMTTRLNLVHSVLTNYVESGSMATDVGRLRGTSDGYMDEIHTLRDTYGADVVSLIENQSQYCGLGYLMNTMSAGFAPYAFSVVHSGCATGYFSFAHEIGHNQGAHHDPANASGGIFPNAYGYQDPFNNTFRTVMAYDCPGGCPRWPIFSHGDNPLQGLPTGYPGAAENALVIDQTASTVAAFRQSATQVPPTAISDLNATGISTSQIDLSWTDTLSDEDNFHVERSGDGLIFTQIATLPADTSSYSDTNLSAEVLYGYRIRASNSSGYADYSNVATAATAYAPPGCK